MTILQRNMKKCGRNIVIIKHSISSSGLSHRGRDKSQDISTNINYANFVDYEKFEVDGVLVKSTDQKILINADIENNIPDLSNYDEIKDGDILWKIKNIKTYRSKSMNLLYKIQARR